MRCVTTWSAAASWTSKMPWITFSSLPSSTSPGRMTDRGSSLPIELKSRGFMVFTDCEDIPDTAYIGGRPTSPIYFLQLMVRYGMVWGRIRPGDDHEMGHFLEEDMPGFLIIRRDLDPLKYVITLGLMKLGAPAVVPSSFPFPYGRRVVADTAEEIVARGVAFPNLRVRYYEDEIIELPDYCNPAYAREQIEGGLKYGGTPDSFFCLRAEPMDESIGGLRIHESIEPGSPVGISVHLTDDRLTDDLAELLEREALKTLNFISGISASVQDDVLTIVTEHGHPLDYSTIEETIRLGLRLKYPRLTNISVAVIVDPEVLRTEGDRVLKYKRARTDLIESMTEENTDTFCVCTECRPFSLEHTCIITPDRVPMCGSRNYYTVKASALFGLSRVPNKRQSERDLPLTTIVLKGGTLDAERGEYEGSNDAYRRMTAGKLSRVYLHSVRQTPHTSCGCFQNLAFWIKEVGGIGIMSRDSTAVTPTGLSWPTLANMAGGKQADGITGVSTRYIRSKHFLRGDGGIENVVWVDSKLFDKIGVLFPPGHRIATERDVQTVDELRAFLKGRGQAGRPTDA